MTIYDKALSPRIHNYNHRIHLNSVEIVIIFRLNVLQKIFDVIFSTSYMTELSAAMYITFDLQYTLAIDFFIMKNITINKDIRWKKIEYKNLNIQ